MLKTRSPVRPGASKSHLAGRSSRRQTLANGTFCRLAEHAVADGFALRGGQAMEVDVGDAAARGREDRFGNFVTAHQVPNVHHLLDVAHAVIRGEQHPQRVAGGGIHLLLELGRHFGDDLLSSVASISAIAASTAWLLGPMLVARLVDRASITHQQPQRAILVGALEVCTILVDEQVEPLAVGELGIKFGRVSTRSAACRPAIAPALRRAANRSPRSARLAAWP